MNEALLARQSWRLLKNPNAYWAKILKGLYFPNSSFLEAVKGSRASWVWLSILHGRETLAKGLRWQVQGGSQIKFWDDKWIPSLPQFKVATQKPVGSSIEWVADIIDKERGCWKKERLNLVVSAEEIQAITSIPISLFLREDVLVWHFSSTGVYTVKSGYRVAYQALFPLSSIPSSSFVPNKNMWDIIWKLDIPHKMRHFWWRACSNSLATKENLVRRRCGVSKVCPICGDTDEAIEHLIFNCQWVRAVWFGCNIHLNLNQENSSSIQRWTSQVVENLKGKELCQFLGKAVTVAWFIWKTRNEFIFNSDPIIPEKTVRRALQCLCEFSEIRIPPSIHMDNPSFEDSYSHWRAPDQGCYKFNCDAAVMSQRGEAAVVSVLRDWKGDLVDGRVGRTSVTSPLQGELLAIRLACEMAGALGISNACIESDNQQAIKLSVSELVPPWEVMSLVSDIRQFRQYVGLSFSWVKRTGNQLAHFVATKAIRNLLPLNWVAAPPSFISSVVSRESPPFL